jgi:two-component system response regulator YesN
MLKLLIMDADAESIRNFKTYMRMSFPQIKTVYTLSSLAVDVMQAVREVMPELIVADIRFFGVSAQKIIRDISEMYPDIKFILYGTYNDSEYIKRVTEYGVIDYMYRPVKPQDFKRCMERALDFFGNYYRQKKANEEVVEKYKKETAFFRDKFFETLVSGNMTKESEILRSFSYFGLKFSENYTVFVVRIDHFKKLILTLDETEKHLLSYKINNLINEKFEDMEVNAHSFISAFNFVTCVVSKHLTFEQILDLCDDLKDDIFYSLKTRVTIGLGRTYENASFICVSYREANAALKYRFLVGHNTTIPIHFVEPANKLTYRYPYEKEDKLISAAVIGEYEYCILLLGQLFDTLNESGYVSGKHLQRLVMGILFAMGRYALEQNFSDDIDITSFFSAKDVMKIKTTEDALNYLKRDIKKFCDAMVELRKQSGARTLEKAKAYINSNYFENLTLGKLSVKLNTTGEFINKLFIDREKMSCFEYIVKVRIEEAKKLILTPDATDEYVAMKVGYDDVRHFRGVFKQKTGQSLSEYRNSRQ